MGLDDEHLARSCELERFRHRLPDGELLREAELEEFISIAREDLMDILQSALPEGTIQYQNSFKQLIQEESGLVTAVEFENGNRAEADFFVAADGRGSRIRRTLFPDHHLIPEQENEIVGIIEDPELIAELGPIFLKTQKEEVGLSFGALPANDQKLIWFMQFDIEHFPAPENTPEAIEAFVRKHAGNWAAPIPHILDKTEFNKVHLWRVTSLEMLPAFHKHNVVLIGDSAHPLLPLTSQGANSALLDGVVLARCFKSARRSPNPIKKAFQTYDKKRMIVMETFVSNGKVLLQRFLQPVELKKDPLPFLVSSTSKG